MPQRLNVFNIMYNISNFIFSFFEVHSSDLLYLLVAFIYLLLVSTTIEALLSLKNFFFLSIGFCIF